MHACGIDTVMNTPFLLLLYNLTDKFRSVYTRAEKVRVAKVVSPGLPSQYFPLQVGYYIP